MRLNELLNFVRIYAPFRYHLFAFVVGACVLAVIRSEPYFWKPEYKSQARLIPPNFKFILSPTYQKEEYQGAGVANLFILRQVATALNSDSTFNYMSHKFKLKQHYGLTTIEDTEQQLKMLREIYQYNVQVDVEERAFIEIHVYDASPVVAAAVAHELSTYANHWVEQLAGRERGLHQLEKSVESLKTKRQTLITDNGKRRKEHGIYFLTSLNETLSKNIYANYFNQKDFHALYDKTIGDENLLRVIDFYIAELETEITSRKEHIQNYPQLLNVSASANASLVIVRPERIEVVVITGVSALVFGLSLLSLLFGIQSAMQSNKQA